MQGYKLLLMISTFAFVGSANAWSLSEFFGFKDTVAEAKEAAREVAAGMIESSRNVAIMTNQFGVLAADIHGSDLKRKAEAKSIIEGVFGVKLDGTSDFKVDISVTIQGLKEGETLRGDLMFLDEPNEELIKSELAPGRYFKPEVINGPQETPSSNQYIEEEIRKKISKFTSQEFPDECGPSRVCFGGGRTGGGGCGVPANYLSCAKQQSAKLLTSAIMDIRNNSQPLPIKSSFSRSYPGGKYVALLLHADDFKKVQDHISIFLIMHKENDPLTLYGLSKISPFQVSLGQLRKNTADTNEEKWSEIRYSIVDLRLEGVLVNKIKAQIGAEK